MNQFRSSLTRIKTLIHDKLPESGDLFDYPGITRQCLLQALTTTYSLSHEIPDDSRFEILSLKRSGSELYRTLRDFFEVPEDKRRATFDSFLTALATLVEKTRMTYFIAVKQGLRNDEELAQIRQTSAELLQSVDELKDQREAVDEQLNSAASAAEEIAQRHEISAQQATALAEWHSKANKAASRIDEVRTILDESLDEIASQREAFTSLTTKIETLAAHSTTTKDRLDKILKEAELTAKALDQSTKVHAELLAKINLSLEDANRIGMASSFTTRKNELRPQQTSWQIAFILALASIVVLVWKLLLPTISSIKAGGGHWTTLVAELGLVTPLVWLGWFAARQYGYTSRIREDYAFKSAAAMAYEGHKKAARETDASLEGTLLEFSLYNMALNPLRLYGDQDVHGSPVHEAASHIIDRLPKIKKILAQSPRLGRVEIIAENTTEKSE